jgi:hypothetical protein
MKQLFSVLLLAMFAAQANAATQAEINAAQFNFNRGSAAMAKHQLGTVVFKQRETSMKCTYDFSTQGGAVGTVNLKAEDGKNCTIPKKAIIRDTLIDVVTAPTSGGSATIAIGSGASATDLKGATAIASYTGLVAGIPIGSAATAIKMAADQNPYITIATAALTAGKLNVHIKYQLSE